MRKTIYAITAAILITALLPASVFAHGHRRKAAVSTRYYGVCSVEGCEIAGGHNHGGVNYYGHYYGDGHSYHDAYEHVGGWHH